MADPEKIFPATPFKRSEARKRGQVAKSKELTDVINLIGILVFFYLTKYAVWDQMTSVYQLSFRAIPAVRQQPIITFLDVMDILSKIITPVLLIALIFGLLGNILQTGVVFSAQALIPKLDKINPIGGRKRLFAIRGLVELGKTFLIRITQGKRGS